MRFRVIVIGPLLFLLVGLSPLRPQDLREEFERIFAESRNFDHQVQNSGSEVDRDVFERWLRQDVESMRSVIPVLLKALEDENPRIRTEGSAFFRAVAFFRPLDLTKFVQGVVPQLIARVDDPYWNVRANIMPTLALLEPSPPPEAVEPFFRHLDDPNGEVRSAAVLGLLRAAPRSRRMAEAVAALLDRERTPEERLDILRTMTEVKPPPSHPLLVAKVAEQLENASMRKEALEVLDTIGPPAAVALPAIREIADDPRTDNQLRRSAQSALRRIERSADPQQYFADLFEKLKSEGSKVETAVFRDMIVWLERQDLATVREAFAVVLEAVEDADEEVRQQALFLVCMLHNDIGESAASEVIAPVVPALIDELDDPAGVRLNVIRGVALLHPAPPPEAVEAFLRQLDELEGEAQRMALWGLLRAEPSSRRVAEVVVGLLDRLEFVERRQGLHLLKFVTSSHPLLVAKLAQQLETPAVSPLRGMPMIGPPAVVARQLEEWTQEGRALLQKDVLEALEKIGPPAALALPRIREIAGDPGSNRGLRRAAQRALRRIEAGAGDASEVRETSGLWGAYRLAKPRRHFPHDWWQEWWLKQDLATIEESIPFVLRALADTDEKVQKQASELFKLLRRSIKPVDASELIAPVVLELIDKFDDPDDRVRFNAIRAVAELELLPPPPEAVEPLLRHLDDPHRGVRNVAVRGLLRAEPVSQRTVEAVVALLDRGRDKRDRRYILRLLADDWPSWWLNGPPPAHPLLAAGVAKQLEERDTALRKDALRALGKMGSLGSSAAAVAAKIREIVNDPESDAELRESAERALQRIEPASPR